MPEGEKMKRYRPGLKHDFEKVTNSFMVPVVPEMIEDLKGKWVRRKDHKQHFFDQRERYEDWANSMERIRELEDKALKAKQEAASYKTINERLRNKIRRLETTTMPTYDEYIEMLSDNRATGPICEGCHRM